MKTSAEASGKAAAHESFPIVGVGASAGGLEAFTELLKHLPTDTGMGYVLVQHLDPQHESALTTILQRATSLPLHEATNNLRVEPNQVYVIPPNTVLSITAGVLTLRPRVKERTLPRSIDRFFEALAQDRRDQAIGVILSGTASDGTLGLEAIKAEGGITFAQDHSARYDSMPRSAVAAGCVDYILSPKDIARELARIAKHPAVAGETANTFRRAEADRTASVTHEDDDTPLPSGGRGTPDTGAIAARKEASRVHHRNGRARKDDGAFRSTLLFLREHSGVDFSLYRSSTIQRRIKRRIVLSKHDTVEEYAKFLRGNSKELDALYSDVLISVTSFFRNPDTFSVLERVVWPALLKQRSDEPLRVWVLGCSTGQEAYSLAMSFTEALDQTPRTRALQVFATDLNETLLEKARRGLYAKSVAQDLSPERLRRFFVEEHGGYRVSKALRDKVVFARQNVISDPPFSRMDLISCRNVLIYLEPDLQKRVFPVFHYALKPGGFLCLGASESIGAFTDLFGSVDKTQKVFAKRTTGLRLPDRKGHPTQPANIGTRSKTQLPQQSLRGTRIERLSAELTAVREADRLTVKQFAPPAVLINANLQVLQFRGPTGAFLEPPKGKASFDVVKMARSGLAVPLRAAINKARRDRSTVRKEGVRIERDGTTGTINVDVIPLNNLRERAFLIVFEDADRARVTTSAAKNPGEAPRASRRREKSPRESELERDLAETQDYLQSIQEQHEASNEELQASSEEVQSANEELQSINEELETSKEELESANEELITVNDEMSHRNAELSRLNSDLINIETSAHQAMVVLGRDLTVRRFSAQAEKQLNLIAADVGRPFSHVRHNLAFPDLEPLIADVIDSVREQEREVQDGAGRWFLLRVRPYVSGDNTIDGAVLVLVDIDALKRAEQTTVVAREYADNIIDTLREPLLVLDSAMRVERVNRAFCDTFAVTPTETIGALLYDLGNRQWDIPELRGLLHDILTRDRTVENYSVTHNFERVGRRTVLLNARRLRNPKTMAERVLLAMEDVSAGHRLRDERDMLAAIVASTDDAIVSKDLDGVITSWNAGAERLFGYNTQEAVGHSIAELLLPPDKAHEETGILERIRRGEVIEHFETSRRRKDGTLVDVSVTISPIRNREGQIVGASKIARDVTEARQLTEELRQADRRKDEFLAMLGHELRNPLAPILTALELMKLRGVDMFTRERGVIERQVRHVARLVDDMLDIARITRGKVSLEKQPVEVAVVIAKAIEIAEPLIAQRGHQLHVAVPEAGLMVDADQVRLSQIFANLLTNAARYTEPGGQISLTAAHGPGEVVVDVKDSGMGLSPEFLPHVFDLFVQGSRTMDRSQGGLGLGLALVQSLVSLHGGSVSAHSEGPGKGSCFSVRLPLSESPRIADAGENLQGMPEINAYQRILLVDDNVDATNMLRDMLTDLGYQVAVAYDGPQALVALETFRPDVAVIDIGLPVMDGYELAGHIRQDGHVPRLIAMTGYGQPADLARSRQAGFDSHLVKPVDMAALIAVIHRTASRNSSK
ncbi:MAG TPA: chemotaxis protein CheB [Vicinamibacterales bacterium]|nr:chemotaxis protein CheB [Vicinamibacterales bacterium]